MIHFNKELVNKAKDFISINDSIKEARDICQIEGILSRYRNYGMLDVQNACILDQRLRMDYIEINLLEGAVSTMPVIKGQCPINTPRKEPVIRNLEMDVYGILFRVVRTILPRISPQNYIDRVEE